MIVRSGPYSTQKDLPRQHISLNMYTLTGRETLPYDKASRDASDAWHCRAHPLRSHVSPLVLSVGSHAARITIRQNLGEIVRFPVLQFDRVTEQAVQVGSAAGVWADVEPSSATPGRCQCLRVIRSHRKSGQLIRDPGSLVVEALLRRRQYAARDLYSV